MKQLQLLTNLKSVQARIKKAEALYQRDPGSVQLLAVSKNQPIEKINWAIAAGLTNFGENYLQEALEKILLLQNPTIAWHFIGNIQANKTQAIAQHFHWVHSISRYKIAERLHRQRPDFLPPLNICLEVNISHEISKSGVNYDEVFELAKKIQQLPRLCLRGLMAIPAVMQDFAQQRKAYHQLHTLYQALITQGLPLDTLSIGMSADLEAAIAEGSTMVRIGTAIFGPRLD